MVIGWAAIRRLRARRKLRSERQLKRRIAPSMVMNDDALDSFTLRGLRHLEAYYRDDVAASGYQVVLNVKRENRLG